jgi:hypothetical protein
MRMPSNWRLGSAVLSATPRVRPMAASWMFCHVPADW